MNVREILTKWGFQIENEKLDRTEKQLEQIKGRLEFLAAAEVIRGVAELTERFAHFAEELHVAATSAGITVEAFQKLAFAAGQSAVTQEEMEHSMTRLTRNLYEARKGSEQAQKVFADAGFSQEQIGSFKTGSDVLLALSDRFKGIQDPIKKQAIAMELMGRGSIHMVGFLSQGSAAIKKMGIEAEHLGIILSEHQVEALVKVEHAMIKLFSLFKAVGATIAADFAPSLNDAIDNFLKFYEANKQIINVNIKAWVDNVSYALGFIWGIVKFVTQAFLDFAKAMHFDKEIGTMISVFVGWVAAIFAFQKAIGLASTAMGIFKFALQPIIALIGFIASPIGLITVGIAALIVIIHDLWTVMRGGSFKDTWIGQMVNWVKSIDIVGAKIQWLIKSFSLAGNIFSFMQSAASKLTGFSGLTSTQNVTNLADTGKIASNSHSNTHQNVSINAPISIHTPSGTDNKAVAKHVKDGVKEHLDRVYRETQRSLRPATAY